MSLHRERLSALLCSLVYCNSRKDKKTKSGANGVAMPTDEDDQDGHFFYNHPERGGYFAA